MKNKYTSNRDFINKNSEFFNKYGISFTTEQSVYIKVFVNGFEDYLFYIDLHDDHLFISGSGMGYHQYYYNIENFSKVILSFIINGINTIKKNKLKDKKKIENIIESCDEFLNKVKDHYTLHYSVNKLEILSDQPSSYYLTWGNNIDK